ncbi:hypothetical protein [Altererythrobacter sp. Z27]|uniref:hypothetical protein n=1 Tax=Altererythrobacter sp. Z27 TaxID=3461147 RepID=UPI004044A0EF
MQIRNCAIALAALAVPCAAQAAAYIKFDGVPGESKVEMSWKVEKGEKAEGYTGGVNVAVGDLNGDGKVDGRDFEVWRNSAAGNAGAPGRVAAPGADPQAVGLLLPAVQKVREAAAARPAGMACEVGATLRNLVIRNEETAQVVRVPEATVTACSAEQISLNFTKVEAMAPGTRRMQMRMRE